jgi:serine/threonine-protein kinase
MNTIAQLGSALSGRYAVEREIGAGGMATVFLARDIRHNRRVALKVLSPELGAVLGTDRFLAEIQVTAALQHPHLLPLFDSGEADGLLFYVMPYVDGESLRARLTREKQLPVDEAVRIACAIASALEYAHQRNVIHRDLKPENILMQSGEPMIADFGIALAVSNAGGARITQTGISLGTPQYMSPEQATGDRAIDGRTDIYSLAALTYEMLTGDPPHTASTAQAIIAKVLTERPTSVRATRATVPRHVSQAIERGLEKLPADRWSSAHDFGEALRGHSAETIVATGTRDTSAPVKSRWQSIRAAAWPVGFAFAAAAAIWGWTAAMRQPTATTVRLPLMMPAGIRIANPDVLVGSGLSLSPDGRRVAFLGWNGSIRGLYVRNIGELEARPIYREGATNPGQPIFSPDGKWIAFIEGRRLKKVPADGGTPIILADDIGSSLGAAWTLDGRIIVAARGTLLSVPESGGTVDTLPRPATNPNFTFRWPVALPDGKTVAFSAWRGSLTSTRIGLVSLSTGKVKIAAVAGNSPLGMVDGHLIYANAIGSLMAIGFNTGRGFGCWTLPCGRVTGPAIQVLDSVGLGVTGAARAALSASSSLLYVTGGSDQTVVTADMKGEIRPLIVRPAAYTGVRYSPDGERIAMSIGAATTDIWIYDVATGTNTRLTTEGVTNDRPEWSPDGSRVLFRTDRDSGGLFSIWWQPSDGTGKAEPFIRPANAALNGAVYEGAISPDGQSQVFRTGTTGGADIWYRGMKGDTSRKGIAETPFTEWAARLSPNSKWVAYVSDESGSYQVYVRPFPGTGPRVQISKDGGEDPLWSRDGLRIFYHHNQEFFAANIRPGPVFAIASYDSLFTGDYLFSPGHATYDVTPDGKGLILIKAIGGEPQTILAHDWKHELLARIQGGSRR